MEKEKMGKTVDKIAVEVVKNTEAIKNLDTKVNNLNTKIEILDKRVGKIAVEVVKHTEAIKSLVTKEEFAEFKDESFTRFDKMLTILDRLDQERVFTVERIRHLEEEVDKIKVHLAL